MKIPQELVDIIVDGLEDSSLRAFCLASTYFVRASQTRIFQSLRIRVGHDGPSVKDYRPMSPQQAEALFLPSPHLASYVRRLWVDIPSPRLYADFQIQTVLSAFTSVRQLLIEGPSGGRSALLRWTDLPKALKDTIQTLMSLSSLKELQLSHFAIPAALISFAATSVPTLMFQYIEDAADSNAELLNAVRFLPMIFLPIAFPPLAFPPQALRTVTLKNVGKSTVNFLATNVLAIQHLSILLPRDVADVSKLLQGCATTLTRLHLCDTQRFSVVIPRLHMLRLLELDAYAWLGPSSYSLPDLFDSFLTQIPSTMPHLAWVVLTLNAGLPPDGKYGWKSHMRAPLDLGPLDDVHCQLCFPDPPSALSSDARRELYQNVYGSFMSSMGAHMSALRDKGGLTFALLLGANAL
ncbi:hypothetical protein K438DRAFT_410565 [Mycena galopus ATCC 62051]|nr:hypothetical protein K438DRAFT_410565 [Mycena galopus ATCC 62051]